MRKIVNLCFLPFILLGCTSGKITVKYNVKINFDETQIDFKDSSLDFVLQSSQAILEENSNNVYSPTTDYLCLLTALLGDKNDETVLKQLGFDSFSELEEVYPKYFEGLNFQGKNTSIKSISSLALVALSTYNDETIKTFADKYKIESLLTEKKHLTNDVEKYYKEKIDLTIDLDDVLEPIQNQSLLALTGLTLKDSFAKSKEETNFDFNNLDGSVKNTKYLSAIENATYYIDESLTILNIKINATTLTFITSDDIDSIDLSTIGKKEQVSGEVHYKVPYFNIESSFDTTFLYKDFFASRFFMPDINSTLVFDSSFQKAKFEFDKNGVKGEAISGMSSIETSLPYEDISINIDKPFYFISSYQQTPLFIGKIVNFK
jgi:serine protease inhibitor